MRTRFVLILLTVVFAFFVLFISILRSASVIPRFTQPGPEKLNTQVFLPDNNETKDIEIHYRLVFPGTVLPDHPLWLVKAARDKVWLGITTSPTKKAELYLLFADKRLGSARVLIENKKYDKGYSTLLKAEHYLKLASDLEEKNRHAGYDTALFLERIANASLMHRLVVEQMGSMAPEEIRPDIINTREYSENAYERAAAALYSLSIIPPDNPF